MLKIEDVKAGDEYQLTTPALKGFVLNAIYTIEKIVGEYIRFKNATDPVYFENLVYFKKVEQSQQYTFDDLIDVAVQAVKDKVINGANIRLHEIGFMHNKTHYKLMPAFDCKEQIDLIKSLYKETFVIETEEDIKRIKKGAEITLSNSNKSKVSVIDYDENTLKVANWDYFLQFFSLKGATVEQERGRDDRS